MNRLVSAVSVFGFFLAAGCGGGGGTGIKDQIPTGHMNGAAWTMKAAFVTQNNSASPATLDVYLTDSASATCGNQVADVGDVQWTQPAAVGTRPLQLDLFDLTSPDNQTVTFYVIATNNNDISTNGYLDVTALSSTSATIGINATGGTGDDVNGTFTATLCP